MLISTFSTLITQRAKFGEEGFQAPSGAYASENPTEDLEMIISNVIGVLTIVAGLYFLINFAIAAINWLGAGGDSGKVQKARDNIVQSIVGLLIVVAAYAIVGLIGSLLGLDILNPGQLIENLAPTP